jgi:hypothetical protein
MWILVTDSDGVRSSSVLLAFVFYVCGRSTAGSMKKARRPASASTWSRRSVVGHPSLVCRHENAVSIRPDQQVLISPNFECRAVTSAQHLDASVKGVFVAFSD